jgi:hypothetical protein
MSVKCFLVSFIQQKRGVSMKKKALLLALALAGSTSAHAQTTKQPEPARENTNDTIPSEKNAVAAEISKLTIIESLQAIKKDPTTVKFHSAMCYDMAMPPVYTTFSCPTCGTETQYHTQSYQGEVANRVAYLSRSLGQIKAKTAVDFSDFCSKCSKDSDDQPELKFNASCIDCGQSFNWTANTIEELEQLPLLLTDFPVTEVDQGHIGEQKIAPEKLSEYLSNRLLCQACREKHGLK